MTIEPKDYLDRQAAFVGARAPGLAAAARVAAAGVVPGGWYEQLPEQEWRFPPAFLPMLHRRAAVVYGAWISDPFAGHVEVIAVFAELPKPSAAPFGRTGLRLLLRMLDELASHEVSEAEEAEEEGRDEGTLELRGTTRAFVDLAFAAADDDAREALTEAALAGFDASSDDAVRDLPILRDGGIGEDAIPAPDSPAPLPAMFARNVVPVRPEDRVPSAPRWPAFDAAMRTGDHRRAWSELNDSGWTYDECVKAFEELAPHIDPEVAELVRAKLDREVFGPTTGY